MLRFIIKSGTTYAYGNRLWSVYRFFLLLLLIGSVTLVIRPEHFFRSYISESPKQKYKESVRIRTRIAIRGRRLFGRLVTRNRRRTSLKSRLTPPIEL